MDRQSLLLKAKNAWIVTSEEVGQQLCMEKSPRLKLNSLFPPVKQIFPGNRPTLTGVRRHFNLLNI